MFTNVCESRVVDHVSQYADHLAIIYVFVCHLKCLKSE